MNLTEANLI